MNVFPHEPSPLLPSRVLRSRLPRLTAFIAALSLCCLGASGGNLTTERFWLENTVTREISGPVLRQTGYRFQIGSQGFVVLDSLPGRIRLATYPQGDPYGPYEIRESHIIDIGLPTAFSITNVQKAEVPELPPDLQDLVGLQIKGEPRKAPPPDPTPPPLPVSEWPIRLGGWLEPLYAAEYDWKVGGFAGSKALDVKSTRFGVSADWGNAFLRLGISSGAKQSGSITPSLVAIESLKIENGNGLNFAAGYVHPFYLAEGWDALVGGMLEWISESYDLVAKTLVATQSEPESDTAPDATTDNSSETEPKKTMTSYEYGNVTSSLDLHDLMIGALAGIQYQEGFWGARALLRIDLLSKPNSDGSVSVNGNDLALEADRSHPISIEVGGWCYVLDQLRADAALRVGAVQALRIGVSWEW